MPAGDSPEWLRRNLDFALRKSELDKVKNLDTENLLRRSPKMTLQLTRRLISSAK